MQTEQLLLQRLDAIQTQLGQLGDAVLVRDAVRHLGGPLLGLEEEALGVEVDGRS